MPNLEAQLDRLFELVTSLNKKVDDAAESRAATDRKLGEIEARLEAVEEATSYNLYTWISRHWKIVAFLSVPAPFFFTAFLIGAWQLKGDVVIEFLREELQQAALNQTILYQPPGLSFIKEPVHEGGKAIYVLVAKRTPVGASCEYQTTVPVFTDELGRTLSGAFESRGRQYGEELTRTELALDVPHGLLVGRVTIELQVVYKCGTETIVHRTDPLAFQLLPARPGP